MDRKSLPVFLALGLAVIILLAAGMTPKNNEVFRIHIRADSDLPAAQAVKYKVKDAVVNFLTPVLADCADKAEAMAAVRELLPEIEKEADAVLKAEGCAYRCRAAVRQEEFPARDYNGVTFEAGVYDALILELGSASGANWWCVVYPPMCFLNGSDNGTEMIRYRSILAELVEKFLAEYGG